jgi:PA domain
MQFIQQVPTVFARSLVAAACALAGIGAQAAKIEIQSRDAAGVGFNDTTPVAPVGGNPGTTLGAQRFYIYRYVADIWERAIQSDVTITVSAGWEALTCDAGSATLGSASAWNLWHDFANGKPGTWYPQALANKLSGVNLSDGTPDDGSGYGNVDIKTQFNINLGTPGCLTGNFFYLGTDGNFGSNVNFVEVLLHELGHGLGFSVLTNTANGFRISSDGSAYVASGGLPSIWEGFMFDGTAAKTWLAMTNAERAASAINPLKLGWNGANAVAGAAQTLVAAPVLKIATPAPGASGFYDYGAASFGPAIATPSSLGVLAVPKPVASPPGQGCAPFDATDTATIAGKVAIIDRGTCGFVVKVKNAQNAGAIGVLIADNVEASISGLGGSDPTITIPAARITRGSGIALKAAVADAVKYGSRRSPGAVSASWSVDTSRVAGADSAGRPLLYTPNPRAAGSSVSHWDTSATPNLLMEPAINNDLTTSLAPPKDLTLPLFTDLGW